MTTLTWLAALACGAGSMAMATAQPGEATGQTPPPGWVREYPQLRVVLPHSGANDAPATTKPDAAPLTPQGTSGCSGVSSYSIPDFNATQWIAQAGFVEREIFAATYSVPASQFPLRIDAVQALFVTSQTTVTTTTEYTVLVWEGNPRDGRLVFSFSSDDIILPHLVIPPGTNGSVVSISVDPNDPEQIIVNNNGSAQFSIGFRIDDHNSQTGTGCFPAPPSNRNAFPAVDADGRVDSPSNNWLFAIDCGFPGLTAPPGWTPFSSLGLFRPSGDWALRAEWTSLSCQPGIGACCLPDGSCQLDTEGNCTARGGVWQGEGVTCQQAGCVPAPQACCFSNGGCLDLAPGQCTAAGGTPGGVGTTCETFECNPRGACCLPNGSCLDGISPGDCAGIGGMYRGNFSLCSQVSCPLPTGGCCFDTGFCLQLTQTQCTTAGATWLGMGTNCANGCDEGGCNAADLSEAFGTLDINDVLVFASAFNAMDPAADLFPAGGGNGMFDINDVLEFATAFNAGCP